MHLNIWTHGAIDSNAQTKPFDRAQVRIPIVTVGAAGPSYAADSTPAARDVPGAEGGMAMPSSAAAAARRPVAADPGRSRIPTAWL